MKGQNKKVFKMNCLRRIARHDDQEFSNQSIINVIEKFVKTVNLMEETILIPSRLMDRQVGDESDPTTQQKQPHNRKRKETVRDQLVNTDLFNLYNMLHNVKLDLLWSRNTHEESPEPTEEELPEQTYNTATTTTVTANVTKIANNKPAEKSQQSETVNKETQKDVVSRTATPEIKGHNRRPSTVSVSSSNSASSTISDSDSEISNENDSGIESENQADKDKTMEISRQFRSNLIGLYKSLEQMTEAASYLTARYQSDMGTTC
jgi:hypothetical protein